MSKLIQRYVKVTEHNKCPLILTFLVTCAIIYNGGNYKYIITYKSWKIRKHEEKEEVNGNNKLMTPVGILDWESNGERKWNY